MCGLLRAAFQFGVCVKSLRLLLRIIKHLITIFTFPKKIEYAIIEKMKDREAVDVYLTMPEGRLRFWSRS